MKRLSFVLLVAFTGCATIGRGAQSLGDATWYLTELDGAPAAASRDTSRSPSLRFDAPAGRVAGSGGCNRLSGPYSTSGATLRFGALAMTRMACADDALNRQETAFGSALAAVDRYEVRGNELLLYAGPTLRVRLLKP